VSADPEVDFLGFGIDLYSKLERQIALLIAFSPGIAAV
jgi:hypothetical protein